MADCDHIGYLLQLASDINQLQAVQSIAAKKLLAYDGETYPTDGCAITQSVLFGNAGIDVGDVFMAIDFDRALKERGWTTIPVGQQQPGDIGTTCVDIPKHGRDHVYLVLRVLDADQMLVADNQQPHPHTRSLTGTDGRTPTTYFLRAP